MSRASNASKKEKRFPVCTSHNSKIEYVPEPKSESADVRNPSVKVPVQTQPQDSQFSMNLLLLVVCWHGKIEMK